MVLKEGRVVEQGSPEILMKDDRGLFKRMVSLQTKVHSGQFRIGYYLGLSSEMRYTFMQNRKFCSAGRNFGLQVQSRLVGKSLHLGYKYKKPTLGLQTQKKACTFVQAEFFGSLDRIRTGDLRLERAAS